MIYRFFPFLGWFKNYNMDHFRTDFVAGLTVALVLIPQSMAYAQLASLPAYYGLYAAFLPPMIASLFGSSRQLATGPVAMVSLMTAAALEPLATAGSTEFIAYAILLALLVGLFQFCLGLFRLGMVINFISHPVVNGFTNAGALIIATSQLANMLGVSIEKADHHYETIYRVIASAFDYTHLPTLILALLAFGLMIGLKRVNPKIPNVLVAVVVTTLISFFISFEHNYESDISIIKSPSVIHEINEHNTYMDIVDEKSQERLALNEQITAAELEFGSESVEVVKLRQDETILNLEITDAKEVASLHRIALKAFLFNRIEAPGSSIEYYLQDETPSGEETDGRTWRLSVGSQKFDTEKVKYIGGGKVVGTIPEGLPTIGIPSLDFSIILKLLPMVIIISLIGFMEAIAIAKAMAAKTGQRLDPNQELIGQGLSNILGSFGRSYPVSGSFSRSAVNIQAGAITGMSGLFTSCVVIITLMFFTPLMYHLPQSVLAAIIMVAVLGLLNVSGFIHSWQAQKFDGIITIVTFAGTLFFAPHLERGIIIGVVLTMLESLFQHMRPDIRILSKHWDGSYKDARKWGLSECKYIGVIRFNGSLFFASASYLEDQVLEEIAALPELEHIIIVGNGINELDATGVESLFTLVKRLRESGIEVSISGLNDAIMEVFQRTHLFDVMGEEHFFRNVENAINTIHNRSHEHGDEEKCPLLEACYEGLPKHSSEKSNVDTTGAKDKKNDEEE
ncbi:MAG: SulP family inorganic anion transporter [bacterium]|nr:SulP family inorganic anion transporter [bacterium]